MPLPSVPVSTDGPPEEPAYEQPLAYSEYTEPAGGQPLPPLGLAPTRWYRQPWALFIFGTITAVVLALVIYAIFELATNEDAQTVDTTPTTTTTAVVVPGPVRTVTETTEVPAETTPAPTIAPTQTQTTTTEPTTTTTTTEPTTTTPTAPPTTTEITITLPRLPLPLPPPPPPPGP